MDLFHNSCCSYANFHSYRSDMIFWNLRLLAAKMPWVKAISVQWNVNTTFKFIHFYYNILYAIEKLWFHSVSFHFIENCHVKGFYLSFLISIKILLSTWKMLSQKLLQSSGYQKSSYEKLWSNKFELLK